MRPSATEYFLKIAEVVATRSTCPRRSVGCVIVNRHKHIIATGYNGVPKGYPHCTDKPCPGRDMESGTGLASCMATHAEQNALLQCPDTNSIEAIYCTTSPCMHCAKLIANTSCKRVYFSSKYSDTSGIDFLTETGVQCILFDKDHGLIVHKVSI